MILASCFWRNIWERKASERNSYVKYSVSKMKFCNSNYTHFKNSQKVQYIKNKLIAEEINPVVAVGGELE